MQTVRFVSILSASFSWPLGSSKTLRRFAEQIKLGTIQSYRKAPRTMVLSSAVAPRGGRRSHVVCRPESQHVSKLPTLPTIGASLTAARLSRSSFNFMALALASVCSHHLANGCRRSHERTHQPSTEQEPPFAAQYSCHQQFFVNW